MINENFLDKATHSAVDDPNVHPELLALLHSTLTTLAESLEVSNENVDPEFVGVGERLQCAFMQAHQLASEMTHAAELMGKDCQNSELNNIGILARSSLTALQRDQEKTSRRLRQVELMADRLSDLHPWSAVLGKIARQLRVISIYFAVEGTRSSQLAALFEAFIQELRQLADWVFEIATNIGRDSRASEAEQKSARTLISDENNQLGALSEHAERAVNTAIRDIERIVQFSILALQGIAEHSQQVSQWVSSAVVAIQFRDITRQQIEHIVAALRDIAFSCAQQSDIACDDTHARNAAVGSAHSILSLQSAQMQSVITSIVKAHDNIERAFREIARESGLIGEAVNGLTIDTENANADADPLGELENALQQLGGLFERERLLNDKALKAAVHAFETSTRLSEYVTHVDDLNSDLALKALNATVKSAKLHDQGRAIAVLAQEVTALSQTCDGFVASMASAIKSIDTVAADLSKECEDDSSDETARIRLEEGIQTFGACYAQFLGSTSAASSKAHELQVMIDKARAELEFLPRLVEKLSGFRNEINAMITMLKPWAEYADVDDAVIEQHISRYTMEHEREVHMQAVTRTGQMNQTTDTAGDEMPKQAISEPIDEELGDNVELF